MENKFNKKKLIFILIPIIILVILVFSGISIFIYNLSPVDSNSEENIKFNIESGWSSNQIIVELKKNDLIRNELFTKLYLKLNPKTLYAGTYNLSKDLSTNEIINKITNQENIENETVSVTFIEGKRLTTYVKQISEIFAYTEEEILNKLNDKEYLESLIDKYWFLTEDILNEEIYYPLEGYLYPDTYEFKKVSTIDEIIDKFLTTMGNKLSNYKEDIDVGNYSIHQMITLASIVELEGVNNLDRKGVAGVFYNRLKVGMTLGSDVTTYYAEQKDFTSDLYQSELNACNAYNTRGNCVAGLPVGPICNAGLSSIAASIEPEEHEYFYFVADNEKKTYFSKTGAEHDQTVSNLKSQGKWET